MKALIARMARLAESRPMVAHYLATGDRTPLLAACDAVEETGVPDLIILAQSVRAAILGG